jgi:hypothetical protein
MLAQEYGAPDRTRTGKLLARDFLTTIAFATISVCGLDYTFIIAFALDAPRLVSTPSLKFPLGLGSVLAYLLFLVNHI